MGIYVQEQHSVFDATFDGIWPNIIHGTISALRQGSVVYLTFPQVIANSSSGDAIVCQIPGNLAPTSIVNIIGRGQQGNGIVEVLFTIDTLGNVSIGNGISGDPWPISIGNPRNGIFEQTISFISNQ